MYRTTNYAKIHNLPNHVVQLSFVLGNLHWVGRGLCMSFQNMMEGKRKQLTIARAVEIGPSGVTALPLAAGGNEGGHYFR